MLRIDRSHVSIWKWLQYMDISNFVIDRRKRRRELDA